MPKRSSKPEDVALPDEPALQREAPSVPAEQPAEPDPAAPAKNSAAVALGKLGGRKGGLARAANLSAKKRKEIAKKAARARWAKSKEP